MAIVDLRAGTELSDVRAAEGLEVLHEERTFAVVRKPSGLRTVPGRGPDAADSIEARARARWPGSTGPMIAHRLDVDTSGLLVLGLTRRAHRALSRQFMLRRVGKGYAALLDGVPSPPEGRIDLPLIVDWPNRPRQMVCHARGRAALTRYRVEAVRADGCLVAFRPETGRTHQLRVHAATSRAEGGLGCPILGDPLYGDAARAPRLMLHASFLAFWHPLGAGWCKFAWPAPFAGAGA